MAKMAQVAVVVIQAPTALGTRSEIADDTLGVVQISRHARDGEVRAVLCLRRETTAHQIVCVQNEVRGSRNVLVDDAEDVIWVGVAREVVAVEVAHQHEVGRHHGQHAAAGELVELHAGNGVTGGAGCAGPLDKRALNPRDDVAAVAIGHEIKARSKQDVVQEIGRGGLAVGTRDEHRGCRLGHAREEVRAYGLGHGTGNLASPVTGNLQRECHSLGSSEREEEARAARLGTGARSL